MKKTLFFALLCLISLPCMAKAGTDSIDYPANHPHSSETMAADPFKAGLPKISTYVPESVKSDGGNDEKVLRS